MPAVREPARGRRHREGTAGGQQVGRREAMTGASLPTSCKGCVTEGGRRLRLRLRHTHSPNSVSWSSVRMKTMFGFPPPSFLLLSAVCMMQRTAKAIGRRRVHRTAGILDGSPAGLQRLLLRLRADWLLSSVVAGKSARRQAGLTGPQYATRAVAGVAGRTGHDASRDSAAKRGMQASHMCVPASTSLSLPRESWM